MEQPLVPLERDLARRADASLRCSSASSGCRRCTRDFSAQGIWASICRAAGVPTQWGEAGEPAQERRVSTRRRARRARWRGRRQRRGRPRRDARAQQCTMCHGAQGMSRGRRAEPGRAVSGSRHQAAARLQERRPHAFASCRRLRANLVGRRHRRPRRLLRVAAQGADARRRPTTNRSPALVRVGDPLRNIAPCISCHGGIDQQARRAVARGHAEATTSWSSCTPSHRARARNDSHAQMRNMVRPMTEQEIEEVSEFYARRQVPGSGTESLPTRQPLSRRRDALHQQRKRLLHALRRKRLSLVIPEPHDDQVVRGNDHHELPARAQHVVGRGRHRQADPCR